MSVLDQFSPTPSSAQTNDYHFEDGDLSFINEMTMPKQPMNIQERPELEPLNSDGNLDIIEDNGEHDELIAAAVEETATIITETIDSGAAFGLHLISKNLIDEHRASDDQKERMRKIIYVYCDKTGGYIPLWLQLVILLVGIYGSQIPAAMQARKINILEQKVEEQRKKLQAYELERERIKLEQELRDKQQPESSQQVTE